MSGYIKLHRGWRNNPVLNSAERRDAWLWLLENACWKPTKTRIKGAVVDLDRGELTVSVRFLGDAWGWSKSRVDRFLADLRQESMIETRSKIGTTAGHQAGQGQAIITICNYVKYQDGDEAARDNDSAESGTTAGQQRDKEEEGKKGRKKNNPLAPLPDWLPRAAWDGFVKMRRASKNPLSDEAVTLAIRKLGELRSAGHDPAAVLEQSILNNWRGLFPIRRENVSRASVAMTDDGWEIPYA
jgi:hypothetical protein